MSHLLTNRVIKKTLQLIHYRTRQNSIQKLLLELESKLF